jgi:NAD-dependent dihydropyrimidine dehydrogenase PreA subunit
MTYVIAEPCIDVKDHSCVEVCPVDCIHPTKEEPGFDDVHQLFIDPAECIDCDACVEACPVDAIFAEDQLPDEWKHLHQDQRRLLRDVDPTNPRVPLARDSSRVAAVVCRANHQGETIHVTN